MELTLEQLAAFRAHLERIGLGAPPPCAWCDGQAHGMPYAVFLGDPTDWEPHIAVACTLCGVVSFFSATRIGIAIAPPAPGAPATEQTLIEIRDLLSRLGGLPAF